MFGKESTIAPVQDVHFRIREFGILINVQSTILMADE